MSALQDIPLEFVVLAPLALAAGVDLYLTLLFLGAAPATGWWETLPGAMGDLASPGVLIVVGSFYLAELAAEGWPAAALFWNAFHAIIRPLSGALLALLLLDGQPLAVSVSGAAAAGLIASAAHASRTGGGVLFWLDSAEHPNRLLVALLEDVAVLGLVVLALDHPWWGLAAAGLIASASVRVVGSQVRAFAFAVRLVWARAWRTLGRARWTEPDRFPRWVRAALVGDVMAPGGGLRGCPAAGHRLPGAPRFAAGWVVIRGDTPIFLYPRLGRLGRVELGTLRTEEVLESAFFRRVAMSSAAGTASLYVGLDGPATESLRAEFLPS